MKSREKIVIEDLEASNLPLIDISSYFSQKISLSAEDYFLAEKFAQINPILERAQREIILDETLIAQNVTQEYQVRNNFEKKAQLIIDEDKSNQISLESLLKTQNPIIILGVAPLNYSSNYSNQNQRGLNYRLVQNSYPRHFAWYDMPKQNIIPAYYKRH